MSTTSIKDNRQRSNSIGYLLVILGAIGFSAKAVLVKLAYQYSGDLDAITLMTLRMFLSLPFFLAVAVWSAKKSADIKLLQEMSGREWILLVGLGCMGYYLASFLDFEGLRYVSAGLERLILFLYPTLVVIFAALFQSKRIIPAQALALAISYSGIVFVFFDMDKSSSRSMSDLLLGSGLILASAIVYALFLMGCGSMVKRIGSLQFTAYSMTVASLAAGLHFAIQHSLNLLQFPKQIYAIAMVMAVFSTVLPAFCMNAGIRRIGASSAATLSSIGPVSTLGLAYAVLGETITMAQGAGTLLVLTGVCFVGKGSQ